MKVIVNASGFYGGTWFEEGEKEQEIAEKVARAFLPPHGDQLSLPSSKKSAPAAGAGKPDA